LVQTYFGPSIHPSTIRKDCTVTDNNGRRFSVSTWSLHRTLGQPAIYGVENGFAVPTETHNRGALSLLELPAWLAETGIHTLEICHFHLPSLDPQYLADLRAAIQEAGVELFSFLIDDGDVTHPTYGERDQAWIEGWFEIASALGARRTRVSAGKTPPSEEVLAKSTQALKDLAERATERGLRLMTENWHTTLSTPTAVHTLFDRMDGRVGLCLDFGNWGGSHKYDDLRSIATYAESCHAKADFSNSGELDRDDYLQCLEITDAANFAGPYTLIYSGPDNDERARLTLEMQVIQPYLNRGH
jgi:hypothetical protein